MSKRDKKLIVLIEDEQVIVNLLTKKLQLAGYEVRTAVDGQAGLELVHSAKPDLLLLDMALPKMSGFQILEKLNEEKIMPKLPVIIISNSGQQIEIEKALKFGIRDYLIKVNFDLDELVGKVNVVFRSNQKKPIGGEQPPEGTVLIVEDDIFLLNLLEKKLIGSNIKTLRAMDINQARSTVKTEPVDLILLDLVMPGGNGMTLLKELKADQKYQSIPIIITSNLGQSDEIKRGLEAGAAEYIVKANITPAEIVARVKKLMKKR